MEAIMPTNENNPTLLDRIRANDQRGDMWIDQHLPTIIGRVNKLCNRNKGKILLALIVGCMMLIIVLMMERLLT
jgi:hypothetical protein